MQPIPAKDSERALALLAPRLERAAAHARGRELDEQQVAVARLAELATRLRAAQALLEHAQQHPTLHGGVYTEQAAVVAGELVAAVGELARLHGAEHGLGEGESLGDAELGFAREALREERLRAIGRELARAGGQLEWPLEELPALARDAAREFARAEVGPAAERIHREDALVPEALIEKMGALGYFGLSIPAQYGGSELGSLAMVVTTEELSRESLAGAGSLITRPEILARALLDGGSEAQKRSWLPRIASGECMVAIAVTEPDVGSDVAAVQCRAEQASQGDVQGWAISGAKAWCTFAGRAELLAVLCRTDPDPARGARGLSLFIVPKPASRERSFEFAQPGGGRVSGRADPTPGYRGMHSFSLSFERYFVPAQNLVGESAGLGRGFYLQMGGFAAGRLQTGARACGLAQAALERSAQYAEQRRQFGRALAEFQLTQYKLGRMGCALSAARALTYAAARAAEERQPSADRAAAQAKLLACRVATAVTQEGQLLHGGWGYAEESAISRYAVDALVLPIFEGVEPILQLKVIGRGLLSD